MTGGYEGPGAGREVCYCITDISGVFGGSEGGKEVGDEAAGLR